LNKYIVVFVTSGNRAEAKKLARVLLEKKLAACVNTVSPVESVYWWKGKLEKAREFLLIVKTRKALLKKIIFEVKKIHSYTVPEVLALPVAGGSKTYLAWIAESTKINKKKE